MNKLLLITSLGVMAYKALKDSELAKAIMDDIANKTNNADKNTSIFDEIKNEIKNRTGYTKDDNYLRLDESEMLLAIIFENMISDADPKEKQFVINAIAGREGELFGSIDTFVSAVRKVRNVYANLYRDNVNQESVVKRRTHPSVIKLNLDPSEAYLASVFRDLSLTPAQRLNAFYAIRRRNFKLFGDINNCCNFVYKYAKEADQKSEEILDDLCYCDSCKREADEVNASVKTQGQNGRTNDEAKAEKVEELKRSISDLFKGLDGKSAINLGKRLNGKAFASLDEFTNAFNKELNSLKADEKAKKEKEAPLREKEVPFKNDLISVYVNERIEIGKKIAALEEMIKAKIEIPGFDSRKEIKTLKLKSDDLKISIAKLRENLKFR